MRADEDSDVWTRVDDETDAAAVNCPDTRPTAGEDDLGDDLGISLVPSGR